VALTVVQWSGLTRILRELVSNIIATPRRARGRRLQLERGRLTLRVGDDGKGGDPQAWSARPGPGRRAQRPTTENRRSDNPPIRGG
jgi:signal transduction histidine kinase